MAQTIKLKRSAIQGNIPLTTQLELGEMAINTFDGKVYIKKNDGTESIVEIGGGGLTSVAFSDIQAGSVLVAEDEFNSQDDQLMSALAIDGLITSKGYLSQITQADVTQYEGALSIAKSQITNFNVSFSDIDATAITTSAETFSDVDTQIMTAAAINDLIESKSYLTTETNNLTASVTWANVPDANITESSVTQHQLALSITESQISDFGTYIEDVNLQSFIDVFTLPTIDGSNGQVLTTDGAGSLSFTTVQQAAGGIENLVEDITPQLGGTLDANGNSIDMGVNTITDTKVGQWDTAFGWGDHAQESYTTLPEVGLNTGDLTGWPNRTDATISFNNANRTLTVSPVGASFNIWYKGNELTISTTKTFVIPDEYGAVYINFDGNGDLFNAGQFGDIRDGLLTAYVFWDNTNQEAIVFGDERHSYKRDTEWHFNQHRNLGAVWRTGGSLSFTLNDDTAVTLGITDYTIADEDLEHSVTHSATPTAQYEQILSPTAQLPILTYIGSQWEEVASTTNPWLPSSSGSAQYNPISVTGSLATVTDGKFITYWLLYTNDTRESAKLVCGHEQHDTADDAFGEVFETYGINLAEKVPAYQIVLECNSSFVNNNSAVRIAAVRRIEERSNTTNLASFAASNHQELTGTSTENCHPISAITGLTASLSAKENSITKSTGYATWTGTAWSFLDETYVQPGDASTTLGSLTLTGDLVVQGTTTTVNSQTLSTDSPLIRLNDSATSEPDLGLILNYNDGTAKAAGLFRDATDNGIFKLFEESQQTFTDNSVVNEGATGYQLATLEVGELIGTVNYSNLTNLPDPVVTVTLSGEVEGTGNATLTDLGNGNISITASLAETATPTITDLTLTGNLTVQGTTVTVNQETLTVTDSKIFLADGNPGDTLDGGVFINYNNGTNDRTAGFFRDASDGKFNFFSQYVSSGSVPAAVNKSDPTYQQGTIVATFEGNLTGNVTGQVSDISNFTTDDITEGSTNLFFTTAAANTAIDNRVTAPFVDALGINYNTLTNKPTSILNFGITDGTTDQVLSTDGAGNFTFVDQTGGGGSFQPIKLDAITTVNGQADYTLAVGGTAHDPASDFALIVSLNGIVQEPGVGFNTVGSTITFIPALSTGDVVDFIIDLGNAVDVTEVVSTDTLDDVVTRGASTTSTITAGGYATTTGTSSQFLKADGSVDTNTYLTSFTETDTLDDVTGRGASTTNGITVGSIDINGQITELTRNATGQTGSVALDASLGTIQRLVLSGNVTFTDSLQNGESVTLMIDDGAGNTITWITGTQWIGGVAPTLDTTNLTVVQIWKINSIVYGALVGVAS